MGYKITRQRYFTDNVLAVEVTCGTKHVGEDVLTTRYKDFGESKYLVSPIDAINCALSIYKRWHNDYSDELKKVAVVNFDGKGTKKYYDISNKRELAQLEKLAADAFSSMNKCGNCQRALGSNSPTFESEHIPGRLFCQEACCSRKYHDMFGVEMPTVKAAKKKK